MKPASLRLALLLSVALNLGVIATVALDRLRPSATLPKPPLHQILGLNADQRARWRPPSAPSSRSSMPPRRSSKRTAPR